MAFTRLGSITARQFAMREPRFLAGRALCGVPFVNCALQ